MTAAGFSASCGAGCNSAGVIGIVAGTGVGAPYHSVAKYMTVSSSTTALAAAASHHHVQSYAERIQIGTWIGAGTFDHLRRHEMRRADGMRVEVRREERRLAARQPQADHAHVAVALEEKILRLHIAVADIVGVQGCQRAADLQARVDRERLFHL